MSLADTERWVRPFGRGESDGFAVAIQPDESAWRHTGLLVAHLDAGGTRSLDTGDREFIVVPLSGAVRVDVRDAAGEEHGVDLPGRVSVFTGPTDVAYVPKDASLTLSGPGGARVALAFAVANKQADPLPFKHIPADDVPVELRGAGQCSREVRNFGTPDVLEADSIIACEVLTPAGNWSSYPPHKHDEERPGEETELEEIYYFEIRPTPDAPEGADAVGYQRVYGAGDRPIDVLAEVRTGDVVLVPHGWHGPAMAPPGYDLYYLNVMAGPGPERKWLICDDPAHGWVRGQWADQQVDPRLPFGGEQ
ncbi:MAG TPA: 5-deoxy-glucuronate isomerase [Segeticoccus sp.]|uniref:5-deoxy-glucuronate isomerase n=1 Tax=Segeticoccus sp. TaxID=2706531 RepID=UPI002D80C88F|nr:5-deoxy-glucuronate isomerase [Segeticoccus sp.]HET8598814.1 5-deoxy-glucuronate isomerase [Segeticoccus sp.]